MALDAPDVQVAKKLVGQAEGVASLHHSVACGDAKLAACEVLVERVLQMPSPLATPEAHQRWECAMAVFNDLVASGALQALRPSPYP